MGAFIKQRIRMQLTFYIPCFSVCFVDDVLNLLVGRGAFQLVELGAGFRAMVLGE